MSAQNRSNNTVVAASRLSSGGTRNTTAMGYNTGSMKATSKHATESSRSSSYKMPTYKPRDKDTQRTDPDSKMYREIDLEFSQNDIKKRKKGIEEDLTIFAPQAVELKPLLGTEESEIKMERPVTPIDKEIKRQPYEWEQMSKYVRRRAAPDKKVEILSIEDQTDLSEILVAEVYHIWPEIKRQIDDPFLTWKGNIELNRRIAVHIVTVCEQLYKHYLTKAQILMQRGVFSGPANMSRLKAQLGIEASKYLNVLMIRRYIVADMKGELSELEPKEESHTHKVTSKKPQIPKLSFKEMLKKSRPKRQQSKKHWTTTEENLNEIELNMPELDTSKLMSVLAELPREILDGYSHESTFEVPEHQPRISEKYNLEPPKVEDKHKPANEGFSMKKSNSSPQIQIGETLLQELGIDTELQVTTANLSQPKLEKKNYHRSFDVLFDSDKQTSENRKRHPEKMTSRELINQDLKKLTEVKAEPMIDYADDDGMPPLLQAIIRHAQHDGKEEVYKRQLAELEEKERKELEERSAPLQQPPYPQPATTAQKTTSKTIVRTSDIRVSERICQENIITRQSTTVYNDLLDEIDSSVIKALDANLFLGDEIKEVYTEIMKTVPRNHLNCEEDESIEKAPTDIELSGLMASSSLTMRRAADRMINPSLRVRLEAPWGNKENNPEWSKTPLNPPKDSRGAPQFDPLVPSSENIAFANDPQSGKIGGIHFADLPTVLADRMTRAYGSWLAWWKGTIDSEDYMKYLATQETDYLAVINHFYDSDAEDDDDERSKSTKVDILNKELEHEKVKKLTEMRAKKQEYTPGMWNTQAILLGGLGKDPDIEDDEEIGRIKSAIEREAIASQAKKKHLGDIVKQKRKGSAVTTSQQGGVMSQGGATSSAGVTSRIDSATSGAASSKEDFKPSLSYQERMEKVWSSLHVPDNKKLDMAIKYSADEYIDILDQVISAWEAATSLILQREQIISELEAFERLASDPNRFFENGYRGSSVARLKESKMRSQLHMKLGNMQERVEQAVKYVNQTYDDVITYQGRPYLEKMQWDRTEMLYWLQEERKQHAINIYNSIALKKQNLTMTPIAPQN